MSIFKNAKLKKKYFGYIEGIIYIIFTIFVIFTNISGPITIKLLPLIFLLGIIGRVVYNRPIITSIFGFLVSICTIYVLGTYSFSYNLMYSLFCFISILLGEVEGMYLLKFIHERKKNKLKNKSKGNNKDILTFILLALAGIYLNNYTNGNIYSYLKCKKIVENYITLNYSNSENVKILDAKYVFNKYGYYSFNVKSIDVNDNNTYQFGVYLGSEVIDGYKRNKLLSKSQMLKDEFLNKIDVSKYKNFSFDIKYSDLQNNITLYITKTVSDINSNEMNNFTEDVNNILENISSFNKFSNIIKMNICIKDEEDELDADIYSTNFYDKEYYINSLETEYLDK